MSRIPFILFAALLLLGCQTVPVYNVVDAPVTTATDGYSQNDVRRAIMRAGTSLGWQISPAGERRLIGTLNQRDTMAQVEISYTRRSYDIRYRDSRNLRYDGGSIRGGYNRWVRNLDKRIRTELAGL